MGPRRCSHSRVRCTGSPEGRSGARCLAHGRASNRSCRHQVTATVVAVADVLVVPLAEERFDLVLDRHATSDARLSRLLDVLQSQSFRRERESLGGYDVSGCGSLVTAA